MCKETWFVDITFPELNLIENLWGDQRSSQDSGSFVCEDVLTKEAFLTGKKCYNFDFFFSAPTKLNVGYCKRFPPELTIQ